MFLENMMINHCKDIQFSDIPMVFFAWLGNIMNHSDSFSQYGFLGSLVFFYNRSSGFLVLKQLHSAGFFHDGNSWHISGAGDFTCDTVTPMPDVLKQISTSHADFVMAGKARHTSCNHCSLILETRSTSIYL